MRYCYNCFQSMPDGATVCPSCGYNAGAQTGKFPMALPSGTVLNGRYILGRVLGQGGFGITYIAQDHKTGVLVAVKEYFPDTMAARTDGHSVSAYTGQREENFLYGKECFLNEAKTLAEFIGNPNIVRVHSYFEENNTAYFVMDYVQGTSLQDYLKQRGRLSWEETKHILEPVIGALASVHSRGVIHRDVTPDNIYITNDGTVKLLDFGAARYSLGDKSRSLDVVLKHGYAPREQYSRHGRQGPYTDVYALGATFYYALTGRLPPDSIDRQDEDEFILPSSLGVKIPPEAEDALCKALAVSAQDRFQSMSEFYLALNEGGQEPAPPVPPSPRPEPPGPVPEPFPGPEPRTVPDPGPAPAPGPSPAPNPTPTSGAVTGSAPIPAPSPPPPAVGGGTGAQQLSPFQEKLAALRKWFGQLAPERKRLLYLCAGAAAVLFLVIVAMHQIGQHSTGLPVASSQTESSQAYSSEGDSLLDVESGQAEGSGSSQVALDEGVLAPASDTETVSLEIRTTSYDENGAIEYYETYEYDDWGNQLRHTYFLADGTVDRYYQYVYDTQGNEIESRHYGGDGVPTSWDESTYDENGCQLTSVSYDEDGAVMWRWEYEYDTSGNKVKSLYYDDGEDTLSGWSEYKYDSQGNEVERRDYDENDVLENVARREYDEAGNEVLFQYYDGEEELDSWTEYEYDDQGNEISSNGYEADGTLSDWSETAYDDHGYSVSHTWTYSPEEEDSYHTYIYQNEYDEDGYIIRRTCYSDGDLRNVTEYQVREIPTTPGGDPDLVLPAMGPGGPVEDTSSSQAESSQPSGSGGFSGSQHGITGMQYAIEDIQSLEGFQDEYSGLPCGGLVEMFGGPWFLGLYELENSDGGTAVYYSLYDLRGNGLVLPASDELFVPAGGNSGQVGIYQDGDGSYYLLEKQGTSQGAAMYTAYTFHALTEDGPVADGSYFGSSDVNYDTGNEVYIIGDTKTDEAGFQEFLDRFTPVCSMDILGNYTGNVITFEEFLQNYT